MYAVLSTTKELSPLRISTSQTLITKATEIMTHDFEGHLRKAPAGSNLKAEDFSNHLKRVGQMLSDAGYDDEVVTAGVCHDGIEDLPDLWNMRRMATEFTPRVALLVDWVTQQDKSLPWEIRNERYLERLKCAPTEAIAISCADKIDNIESLLPYLKLLYPVSSVISRGWATNSEKFWELKELFLQRLGVENPLYQRFERSLAVFDELGARLEPTPKTEALCMKRWRNRFEKALETETPSTSLEDLKRNSKTASEFARFFPELDRLAGVDQSKIHHPEGNVWKHTLMVVDAAAKIAATSTDLTPEEKRILLWGTLLHDVGKGAPGGTQVKHSADGTGKITARGHEKLGVPPATEILNRLGTFNEEEQKKILAIVKWHMFLPAEYRDLVSNELSEENFERKTLSFLRKLEGTITPNLLLAACTADYNGRGNSSDLHHRTEFIGAVKTKVHELLSRQNVH